MWTVQFETMASLCSVVYTICIWPLPCVMMIVIKTQANGQLRQCLGTLPRVEAHNMLSSIHHKYCNYTTSNEWLTSPTAIALPGIIVPPSEFYLDFIEQTLCKCWLCRRNLFNDSRHILLLMMPPPVVADFRTGRMDNASFTLTSFVSTLQQWSSSTGYNQVQNIWAQDSKITGNVGFAFLWWMRH